MSQFSSEWLAILQMRRNAREGKPMIEGPAPDKEADLHAEIIAECNRRGWYFIHSRMDKKTTTKAGVPDFLIRTERQWLAVECKAKTGKLSLQQMGTRVHLSKLNETLHVVYSLSNFIAVAEGRG